MDDIPGCGGNATRRLHYGRYGQLSLLARRKTFTFVATINFRLCGVFCEWQSFFLLPANFFSLALFLGPRAFFVCVRRRKVVFLTTSRHPHFNLPVFPAPYPALPLLHSPPFAGPRSAKMFFVFFHFCQISRNVFSGKFLEI